MMYGCYREKLPVNQLWELQGQEINSCALNQCPNFVCFFVCLFGLLLIMGKNKSIFI